jgi:hypothetical protein
MRYLPRSVSIRFGLAMAAALAIPTVAAAQNLVGLSTVRSQRFGNENLLGFFTPQANDVFAWALATGDFNGDGADELATGIPLDNGIAGSEINDCGAVVVRNSSPGRGLATNLASNFLRQTPARDPAEAGDTLGSALAVCDFNGDNIDDLAIGVAFENHLGESDAGAIQVHFGTSAGLPFASDTFITQSTPGVPGDVEAGDGFGHALACGDFNGDTFDDLAVGVPDEDWGILSGASKGMIDIIPGSPFGLNPAAATHLDQDVDGMGGDAEFFDQFGWSLAAGNFNGDLFMDLAVGVPGEDDDEGMVQVVFGGPTGLTPSGSLFWSETFVGGASEEGDNFSEALATGDFDGDGFDDLAIGIPSEDSGAGNSVHGSGQVAVLYGSPEGFDRGRTQFWSEDNIWFTGASEEGDQFGVALAAGDFDKDGRDDLAIGHYSEFVLGPGDGAATILMGSAAGLTAARRKGIAAGVEGFGGDINEHQKGFAFSLATGDFDADGHADLAIGVPGEDQNGIVDAGGEMILYGSLFGDGFESGLTTQWPQTVTSSPPVIGGGKAPLDSNRVQVNTAARLGPSTSRFGLQVELFSPTLLRPAIPTYVRVGPESGFNNETVLKGSFFINPQSLTMSTTAGNNSFQMMAFNDGLGAAARTRLVFFLVRNPGDGDWFISAFHFNEGLGGFQLSGSGFFALDNNTSFANNRIDFEWTRGNPGQLTMRRTRFLNGVPDVNGTIQMFSVPLPGMPNAVINHVFAGMFAGHRPGTFGVFYLDEFVFKR